jgi:tRNA(fMet)-specific endonuclease VapC
LHIGVRQFLKIARVLAWDTTGQPIGEMDRMIAAHSLAAGAVLVTNNTRHYERISTPLMLQNWSGGQPA